MIRSVLSVLAGIAVLAATSFAIEAALNPLLSAKAPNPNDELEKAPASD
jgi:hypothetical protein